MPTVALVAPTATVKVVLPAACAVQVTRLTGLATVGTVAEQRTMPDLLKDSCGFCTAAAGNWSNLTRQVAVFFVVDPAAGDTANVEVLVSPVSLGGAGFWPAIHHSPLPQQPLASAQASFLKAS